MALEFSSGILRTAPWPIDGPTSERIGAAIGRAMNKVVSQHHGSLEDEDPMTGAIVYAVNEAAEGLYSETGLRWTARVVGRAKEAILGADYALVFDVYSANADSVLRKLYLLQSKDIPPGGTVLYANNLTKHVSNMLGTVVDGAAWICVYQDAGVRFVPAFHFQGRTRINADDGMSPEKFLADALECRHGDRGFTAEVSVERILSALHLGRAAVVKASPPQT